VNKKDLISELNSWNTAERAFRNQSAKFVLDHPETFPFLIKLVFEGQERIHIKAAWILELVCIENIFLISSYLDYFSKNLVKITNESALRPIAKVCSFIAGAYYSNSNNDIHNRLSENNTELIIESNFDWLIGKHKIACKVYAMDTLFLFGSETNWVHKELKLIIEQNIIHESPGYLSHAKKILKKLNASSKERI